LKLKKAGCDPQPNPFLWILPKENIEPMIIESKTMEEYGMRCDYVPAFTVQDILMDLRAKDEKKFNRLLEEIEWQDLDGIAEKVAEGYLSLIKGDNYDW
jgi:hypothetical protein